MYFLTISTAQATRINRLNRDLVEAECIPDLVTLIILFRIICKHIHRRGRIIWIYQGLGTMPLQLCHNGRDGVSNHQPRNCLLKRLFTRRSKMISKLRVTGLCQGNSPVTDEFLAQRASKADNFSIWWRHHGWWHFEVHSLDRKFGILIPILMHFFFRKIQLTIVNTHSNNGFLSNIVSSIKPGWRCHMMSKVLRIGTKVYIWDKPTSLPFL